ncbi:MAG TPA: HDOD domain-containing protein [Bacteroidota bacterium]|nr:HDOD domain-containing protein [Bacteroidota bacterium]
MMTDTDTNATKHDGGHSSPVTLASFARMLRIMELLNNPRITTAKIGREISADEQLAKRLLRAVNSPLYGFSHRVSAVDFAVSILGHEKLKDVMLSTDTVGKIQKKIDNYLDTATPWSPSLKQIDATKRLISDLASLVAQDGEYRKTHSVDEVLHPAVDQLACAQVGMALKQLAPRQRLIMMLYYYEEATFDEIGSVLGLVGSRIAQLYSEALNEVSQKLDIGELERVAPI